MQCQLWSFKYEGTKLEIFLPVNQRKSLNFENWCSGELSKIGHHFSNKVILKLMLSKNVNDKRCDLWKKNQKDQDDFLT